MPKNKKPNQKAITSKYNWIFFAKSYLALAYIGIQELKYKKYLKAQEMSVLVRGTWQVYDAQLLLIPIIWNLKHGIELIYKALDVTFVSEYLKNHDIKKLREELGKVLEKKGPDKYFDEFVEITDKYYKLDFFNSRLRRTSKIVDKENDIFRYPEGSKTKLSLELREFQSFTKENFKELEEDIEIIYRRLAVPAEYKHLKKYWKEFAH